MRKNAGYDLAGRTRPPGVGRRALFPGGRAVLFRKQAASGYAHVARWTALRSRQYRNHLRRHIRHGCDYAVRLHGRLRPRSPGCTDRKRVVTGKSVEVSVDLVGRRIIKKKKK